jgi:hypothetical protein
MGIHQCRSVLRPGLAYGHQGKYDEALKSIDQAIKLKPGETAFTDVKKILSTMRRRPARSRNFHEPSFCLVREHTLERASTQ